MAFKQFSAFYNPSLREIDKKIKAQDDLLTRVKGVLPAVLAEQIVYCLNSKQRLIVYTQSASWASQLRFYSQPILEAAHAMGVTDTQLQFRIVKIPNWNTERSLSITIPSLQQAEHINAYSTIVEDEQLKAALFKLSQTLRQLSK